MDRGLLIFTIFTLCTIAFVLLAPEPPSRRAHDSNDATPLSPYDRVERIFGPSWIYKPTPLVDGELSSRLAPLFLIERDPELLDEDPSAAAAPVATVTWLETEVSIGDASTPALIYAWRFPAPLAHDCAPLQAVRIVLDASSRPLVQETLRDSSELRVLYVSTELEEAARAEFGPPLPGRRYSVERSLDDAPHVIVARAISPGPIPMGPWVYLDRESCDVSTLICRCMPSQVEGSLRTESYTLRPQAEGDPPALFDDEPLEAVLRWSAGFRR